MKRKTMWGLMIVGLVVLLGGGIFAWHKAASSANGPRFRVVRLHNNNFAVTGSVQTHRTEKLTPKEGKVQQLFISNGETVTKGQELLSTFDESKTPDVQTAQQAVAKSQRELNQQAQAVNDLKSQLNQTPADDPSYEQTRTQLKEANNSYKGAQADLQDQQNSLATLQKTQTTILQAPYDGVATVDYALDGTPQITIVTNDLQVRGEVTEYDYAKLKVNQPVKIKALANGKQQTAAIDYLANNPAPDSRKNMSKYEFTVPVDNRFMNGQTVNIKIPQDDLRLPFSAVRHGQVFVYRQGRAYQQAVTVQKKAGYYRVKTGLHAGSQVIINPNRHLRDQMKVQIND